VGFCWAKAEITSKNENVNPITAARIVEARDIKIEEIIRPRNKARYFQATATGRVAS
jgi:hypothetical protein